MGGGGGRGVNVESVWLTLAPSLFQWRLNKGINQYGSSTQGRWGRAVLEAGDLANKCCCYSQCMWQWVHVDVVLGACVHGRGTNDAYIIIWYSVLPEWWWFKYDKCSGSIQHTGLYRSVTWLYQSEWKRDFRGIIWEQRPQANVWTDKWLAGTRNLLIQYVHSSYS